MKINYLHLLLCLVCIPAFSSFSQIPGTDAVYLQLTREYTLNPDGSMDFRHIKKLKLLTYRSFLQLYGETFITYNPAFQEIKINDAYTVMANGKKVQEPKNAFNEVLPGFAANAPEFNNLREMVITHVGTERNAILNLDYQVHSKKGFSPAYMGNEVLAEAEPVNELTIRIRIPDGVKLYYKLLQTNSLPVISTETNFKVFTWNLKNVSAISPEEFQKSGNELYPRLIFSTSGDRMALYSDFLRQPAFSYTCDDEMKQAVKATVGESTDKKDILLKLQQKATDEFRLWPIPLRYIGFTLRTAPQIWHSNGGTLAEKAALLVSLLKEAGIKANPLAVVRKACFDEKIASLLDIEDIIVKAEPDEKGAVYLSVNTMNPQSLEYSMQDKVLVNLKTDGKVSVQKMEEYDCKILLKGMFTVGSEKKMTGEISAGVTNGANPWLVLSRDKTKAKSWFGGGIGSADLKEQGTSTIGKERSYVIYTVEKEKPFRKDSSYYFFSLPVANPGIEGWSIWLLPEKRETALELPFQMKETDEFEFNLPKEMKLFSPEKKVNIVNSAGSFLYEIRKDKGTVYVRKGITFTKRAIDPAIYNDFRVLMNNWNNVWTKEIIFTAE
ncbi:MAG: DUF3857 domain-containing protein [Bacteroidetes bacterium]|nr:DUF3857 domain-containing protein [Bacteroidota bacterium]